MIDAIGHQTIRLKRVKYGPIEIGTLARGEWRDLTPEEVASLKAGPEKAVPEIT
jgi:16S rRNA U516 pseudouridylate synthase RsuA-like enzyme